MCRHCERIVEDVQHKETVHKFMAAAADGVNRKLREQHKTPMKPVTADDIDIDLKVTATYWHDNPISHDPAVIRLVYRDLLEAVE